MMAFFDFILKTNSSNKSECESTMCSDLNSNSMIQNTIKQEETSDSAKSDSIENLEHPFHLLFGNAEEAKNDTDISTPVKTPNDLANKSARRRYKRKQKKSANSVSSETASEKSKNTDISSNLDSSQVTTPKNTVSKKQMKRQNFIKNSNGKNSNFRPIPSIFDPIDEQYFERIPEKSFNFYLTRNKNTYQKFNPKNMQGNNQNSSNNDNFFKRRSQSSNHLNNLGFNAINKQKSNLSNLNLNNNLDNDFSAIFKDIYKSDLRLNGNFIKNPPFSEISTKHPSNNNPYKWTKPHDPNFNKQFNNMTFSNNESTQNVSETKYEQGFRKFVKMSDFKNRSYENSLVISDTSNESKGYATNKYQFRNPNWKKKNATTNTATANVPSNTSAVVDDIFKKANKNMRARNLYAHEVVSSLEDALKVVQLMSDEDCTQEEAVSLVTGSTKKVQCSVCCLSFEHKDIEAMLSCEHQCCTLCAKNHFTEQIRNKSLKFCVCFACDEPKWLSCDLPVGSDKVTEYFGMLDIVLRRLLDTDVHDIFQNKLRDFSLAQEENFKWCPNCSFGYFIDKTSNIKFVICENCEFASCISCSLEWKSQHEKISCEQYKQWLEDNNEDLHKNTVKNYIEKNGIVCPNCKYQYILSRGGCMHFTCNQCKYEFCYGCNKPFYRDSSKCRSLYCQKLGLHAHHPMNCMFYLRDKEPADLKRLLLINKIDFLSVCENVTKCPIPLQKEDNGVLYDEICNEDVTSTNQAGLCQKHYIEYLTQLIFKNDIDCSSIMTAQEIKLEKLRSGS